VNWRQVFTFGDLQEARDEIKHLREKVAQQEAALVRAADALAMQKRALDAVRAALAEVNWATVAEGESCSV
jgi:hypothetical protein